MAIISIQACYPDPEVKGFDKEAWKTRKPDCSDRWIEEAQKVVSQKNRILGLGQAEVTWLLGSPEEHELYARNQKFYYYHLTADTCEQQAQKRLNIHFDAIDRVKEIVIDLRE